VVGKIMGSFRMYEPFRKVTQISGIEF